MKNDIKRCGCLIIAAVFSLSVYSACSRSEGTETTTAPGVIEEFTEDTPWYDVETIALGSQYDINDYSYIYSTLACSGQDRFVCLTDGERNLPANFNYDTDDYDQYLTSNIDIYDATGSLVSTIGVNTIQENIGLDAGYSYIRDMAYTSDGLLLNMISYSGEDWSESLISCTVDPDTGAVSNVREGNTPEEGTAGGGIICGAGNEGSVRVGDYNISKYYLITGDGESSYILEVEDASGNVNTMDLRELLPGVNIFNIDAIVGMGADQAIAMYYTVTDDDDYMEKYILLDLAVGTASEYTDDMSWADGYDLVRCRTDADGSTVIVTRDGLSKVDFGEHTITPVFSFSNSNVNRYDSSVNMDFLCSDGDNYIFSYYSTNDDDDDHNYQFANIVRFRRCETNPNVGKTVLRAASPTDISYPMAEAICRFNDNSENYFIAYDTSYNIDSQVNYNPCSPTYGDGLEALDAQATMSNTLMIDLLAGDGPDIIMNMSTYSQLNDPDYLLDLSSIVPSNGYFDNVFDACRTDGALYQMPLTCGFAGITTGSDGIGYDQIGFTFDQYADFVDEVCNGNDPLRYDRLDYFALCYMSMSDDFTGDDGRVDLDNEAFRELAAYVRDHVNDADAAEDGNYYCDVCARETDGVGYTRITNLDRYLCTFGGSTSSTRIMGIPSADGRGPSLIIDNSLGISSCASDTEGCMEFVNYCLSGEVQEMFGRNDTTPVSEAAMRTVSQEAIDRYNAEVETYLEFMSPDELMQCGFFAEEVDASIIDAYIGFIRACNNLATADPTITKIIREELPAYIEGQKSIDDVIDILQDRINTFLNERG